MDLNLARQVASAAVSVAMKLKMGNQPPTLFPAKKAEQEAKKLQRGDPDWEYRVEYTPDRKRASIRVYDEDGEQVGHF